MKADSKSQCTQKTEKVQYATGSPVGTIEIVACSTGIHSMCRVTKPDSSLQVEPSAESYVYLPYLWCQHYFSTKEDNLQKKMNPLPQICWSFVGKTDFEKQVLKSCLENVKLGQTVSYGELANLIEKPGASRAVGNALRRNPVPFLIPCHRVIHANGNIGKYAGGENSIKCFLLDFEK